MNPFDQLNRDSVRKGYLLPVELWNTFLLSADLKNPSISQNTKMRPGFNYWGAKLWRFQRIKKSFSGDREGSWSESISQSRAGCRYRPGSWKTWERNNAVYR